jgi:saccharopine dehydrogenase-like NADP-dependent oxidoreductase
MIVLCHYFLAKFPGGKDERITSTMVDYGRPDGDSSMARTVSLPAAIGAKMILTGEIMKPGVYVPVTGDIYNPVLDELANLDIKCVEKTEPAG